MWPPCCTGGARTSPGTGATPPTRPSAGQLSWRERADRILDAARGATRSDPVNADAADALRQVADAMDSRADELAHRYAQQAAAGQHGGYQDRTVPAWLAALGPVPTTGRDLDARREAWLRHARAVAIYHDVTGYQPTGDDPIGPRPPAGDAEARELWTAARAALADAPIAATMRAMLPDRLHTWVAEAVHAETADQPAYVGHDLRSLHLRARAQRTRVTPPAAGNHRHGGQAGHRRAAPLAPRPDRDRQPPPHPPRHRRPTRTKPGHAAPDRT